MLSVSFHTILSDLGFKTLKIIFDCTGRSEVLPNLILFPKILSFLSLFYFLFYFNSHFIA